MELLMAAALAVCTTTPENCKVEEFGAATSIYVCDIAPEVKAEDVNFIAELPDGIYYFTLAPKCKTF